MCKTTTLKRAKNGFQDQLSLNVVQKYCRILPLEHSAILSTFIKLPVVIKTFVLSIFEWLFTQVLGYSRVHFIIKELLLLFIFRKASYVLFVKYHCPHRKLYSHTMTAHMNKRSQKTGKQRKGFSEYDCLSQAKKYHIQPTVKPM